MNPSIDSFEAGELLASLVDKSLVVFDESSGRYRILETVRQYARDRLFETGKGAQWRNRHLAFCLAFAERAEPQLRGVNQSGWLETVEQEHENLRAALEWASGSSEHTERGLRLVLAISRFWYIRRHLSEGAAWLDEFLSKYNQEPSQSLRASALSWSGFLRGEQGEYEQARTYHQASLAISRELGNLRGVANSLSNLGNNAHDLGEPGVARALLEESLALNRELGDPWAVASSLNNLGNVELVDGKPQDARARFIECVALLQEGQDPMLLAIALNNLGSVFLLEGDYKEACRYLKESLALRWDLKDRGGIAGPLEGLAGLATASQNWLLAARLWGAAERLRDEFNTPRPPDEKSRYEGQISTARDGVKNKTDFAAAWQEGRSYPLERAVELALKVYEL